MLVLIGQYFGFIVYIVDKLFRFNLESSLATNLRNIQAALLLSLGILSLL